jgi:ketosteroid isomerase-like protein
VSQENVEVVRRVNELFIARAWDAMFELFDPEIEFRDLQHAPDLPETLHGRHSIRRTLAHWIEAYDEFGAEIYEYIDADPWVVVDVRWHGKGKGSGLPIDVHVADACKVEDGTVVRWIIGYPDVVAALRAVGLEE